MSQYFFTVASLPYLSFNSDQRISLENFYSLCETELSPGDLETLKKTGISSFDNSQGPIHSEWLLFEKSLRVALAKARAGKLGKGFDSAESFGLINFDEEARQALAIGSPLEAELFLDQLRWNYLDELKGTKYFQFDALIIYHLKLQILSRQSLFDTEKGEQNFNNAYQVLSDGIKEIVNGF